MGERIAFFDAKPYDIKSFDEANRDFGFNLQYYEGHLNINSVSLARDCRVVCVFVNDTVDAGVAGMLHKLGVRMIALRCAGYNNVDLNTVYKRIHVARVPAYSPYAVAEHAATLMMTLNRKTHRAFYRTKDNNFSINGLIGFDMHGKTLGVIGTGKIGQVLISIARGFGMQVLAYDKFPDEKAAAELGFRYAELDELYASADIISLHCPLTPETNHMINMETIGKMKDGVMIINTGRGALISTKDLISGIKSKKIGSAGLDVYEEETDYFFEDFSNDVIDDDDLVRMVAYPNVLVTSHQGFFTREAMGNIARATLNNIKEFVEGKDLTNEICYRCEGECVRKKTGKCF